VADRRRRADVVERHAGRARVDLRARQVTSRTKTRVIPRNGTPHTRCGRAPRHTRRSPHTHATNVVTPPCNMEDRRCREPSARQRCHRDFKSVPEESVVCSPSPARGAHCCCCSVHTYRDTCHHPTPPPHHINATATSPPRAA
jgi:hypothetical protein